MDGETAPARRASMDLDRGFFLEVLGRLEDPIFVKDAAHRFIFVNDALRRLHGRDDLIGRTDRELVPPEQYEEFIAGDRYVLESGRSLTQEESIGPDVWALVKKTPVTLPDGKTGILGIIIDITEYRSIKIEVEALRIARRQALHDPLTDLPNRRHLEEYFAELVQRGPARQDVTLMHLDLDDFKAVNDEAGHAAGDAVLVHVADTIRKMSTPQMFAARIGGDEFVVLCTECPNIAAAEDWARRFIATVRTPVVHEGKSLRVGSSVGIASARTVPLALDALLHAADLALYTAKQNGRNRVELYSEEIGARDREQKVQRAFLEAGLADGAFQPFYQPQFDLVTGAYTGVEALARWHHPERGLLAPNDFLPLFDADGRIDDLDLAVLARVVADADALAAAGVEVGRIAINMSSRLLFRPDMLAIFGAYAPFRFDLAIEFAESISFERINAAVRARIDGLKALGCAIEIDDFGSSQASILGVVNLRPDRLKLDRQLVIPLLQSPQNRFIVEAILRIAASLGIPVIAEGIESAAHVTALREMGCDFGQGFHFAPPMPRDALAGMLRGLGQTREGGDAGPRLSAGTG